MKKRHLLICVLLIITTFPLFPFAEPPKPPSDTKTLATVDGEVITNEDFNRKIRTFPKSVQAYYRSEEGKKKLLEQLIDEKVLYLEGKNKDIDKEAETISEIERIKKEIIASMYLQKLLADIDVSDEEARQYYNKNKDKYYIPEKVKASHILVKTKEKANTVYALAIKNKSNFANLAKKHSVGPTKTKGGSLGWFQKGQMVKPFEDAAFALSAGGISKPVKTRYGYHIIYVQDKSEAKQIPFNEAKIEIYDILRSLKQKDKIQGVLDSIKNNYSIQILEENTK
ncbi:peptidylprolyl isomerase [Candidatus Margulisiibacteriota bacterium]